MRLRYAAVLLMLTLSCGGCALSENLTVPKVMGACRTPNLSSSGNCGPMARDAICNDYGDVLYTPQVDKRACRQSCQNVYNTWFRYPEGMACTDVLGRGGSLCKQYCNGLYGENGSGVAPVREKEREQFKLPGIPEVKQ